MIITAAKYVKHARLEFGNRYTSVIYKTGMCIIEVSNFAYIFEFYGIVLNYALKH